VETLMRVIQRWKATRRFWRMLSAMIFLCLCYIVGSEVYAMAQRVDGFRFEDYETGDEAKKALLRDHPIGSYADDLVQKLEALGAECGPITNPELKDLPRYQSMIYCVYNENKIFVREWKVSVDLQKSKKSKIRDLRVSVHLNVL